MSQAQSLEVGSKVVFTGFTGDELPDNSEALEEGQEYTVVETKQEEEDSEVVYLLEAEVDNPDYDDSKRKTKKNQPTMKLKIDVFEDEIEISDITDDDQEEEVESKPAKRAAAKKEPAKKAAAKSKSQEKREAVQKKAPAKKAAKPEPEEDEVDADEQLSYADMKRGMEVTAYDGDEMIVAGTITSKTKRGIKIADENGEETTLRLEDTLFYEGIIEEESEEMDTVSPEDDPELKDMLILTEDEEDAEIVSLVAEAEDLCELAHDMSEESASLDYRLGGVLYHVRLSGAYKELNEDYSAKGGFMAYVEEELPVGYRKAMYLIDIYAKWNKFNLPMEKVQEIGWTKAQEIARVMDAENAEDLVALAEQNTVQDLKESIKESYTGGQTARESVKRITFKFRLTEDAAANVRDFFEQGKESLGLERDEEVFEQIVTQWATDHLNIKKVGRGKKKAAAKK